MTRPVATVFFDLDETLVTGLTPGEEAAQRRAVELFPSLRGEAFRRVYLDVVDEQLRRGTRERRPPDESGLYWHMAETLGRLGITDRGATLELVEAFLGERTRLVELMPGAIETLRALRRRYVVGMITNGWVPTRRRTLEHFGLEPHLDPIVISEEAGYQKPDRRIYDIAIERAATSADRAVMIGDNYLNDVVGAKGAGLRAVWLRPGGTAPPPSAVRPDFETDALAEAADWILHLDEISEHE